MTKMTTNRVAYHEAGHAVAIVYAGFKVSSIFVAMRPTTFTTIKGEKIYTKGACLSNCSYHPRPKWLLDGLSPAERTRIEENAKLEATVAMMSSLAGPLAEARKNKASQEATLLRSASDLYDWADTAESFPKTVAVELKDRSTEGVYKLVFAAWPAITKVADMLVGQGSLVDEAHEVVLDALSEVGFIPGVPRMPWAENSLGF